MKNFVILFLFSLLFLSSCDVMKRKYMRGFYVGRFSKWNSGVEKNIQAYKNKEVVENKCADKITSSHTKAEKKNNLLPVTITSKQGHSNSIFPKQNRNELALKKKKAKRNLLKKNTSKKAKFKTQKIKSFDLIDKLIASDFLLWFVILVIPPVLTMTLIKEGPVAVTLYTIGWTAGIFCLFFLIHLLWLSILLIPVWGFVSLFLGIMIYTWTE